MKVCSFCNTKVKSLNCKNPPACVKCYHKHIYEDKRLEKTDVECEFQISNKCSKIYNIGIRAEAENRKRNNGYYICLQCSRTLKYSGRNNPNCKYDIKDFQFSEINNENKAYILGWIASDGSIVTSSFSIYIHKKDIDIIRKIRDFICKEIPIKPKKKDLVGITISSKQMVSDICLHLGIKPGAKARHIQFPYLETNELKWAFIRGYFDGDGCVSSLLTKKRRPRCSIASSSKVFLNDVFEFVNIPGSISGVNLEWNGNNALDFLGKIYNNFGMKMERKYNRYLDWSTWEPGLSGRYNTGKHPSFKWNKTDKKAAVPFKARVSDSGYDLTIIEKIKTVGDVEFYTTGIKIQPSFGYYFDLVPRSSISKSGYMLANSVGIIDRTYIGPIIIALRKIDKDAKDLELPCVMAQIIPRHIIHMEAIEVEELDLSERNDGGFGSTT